MNLQKNRQDIENEEEKRFIFVPQVELGFSFLSNNKRTKFAGVVHK